MQIACCGEELLRKMPALTIRQCGTVKWNKRKKNYGDRLERHRLYHFVKKYTNKVPVRVLVTRLTRKRQFRYQPLLVDGFTKLVMFTKELYLILVPFDDVIDWLREQIIEQNLFEKKKYHHYTHDYLL